MNVLLPLKWTVFYIEQMNKVVVDYMRFEDTSLGFTGIESQEGLSHYGLYDTVVARE